MINWHKQAKQFLKLHGWEIDEGVGFHPCFPLGEEFSNAELMIKFCEGFYGEAWKHHKAFIRGYEIMQQEGE